MQQPSLQSRSILALLNQCFGAAITAACGQLAPTLVQVAARPEFGDYQINGIMPLAKKLKLDPRSLAQNVVEKVQGAGFIDKMSVAGPGFINVSLTDDFLLECLFGANKAKIEGSTSSAPQTLVIDYSSVNLAKEMHVGHLRSTIIGDALARLHSYLGHRVIRQNHVGDWGTQFGMLVAYLKENPTSQTLDCADLSDLETFYRLAKTRFDDPEFADIARQHVVRLQAGDPEVLALWHQFVEVSLSHCDKVYQTLGVLLTRADVRGESAYNAQLPILVEQLLHSGIAQLSQGAVVVFLDDHTQLDVERRAFMIQKRDGGYLYGTTDLAALCYRAKELQADRCLYVVDSRQALHFEQLFAVAKRAGLVKPSMQLEHVAFGMVLGPDRKPFKTREGQSIKLSLLLKQAIERAKALVMEKQPNMPATLREQVAHALGIGAVKYADLSKNRSSDYVFDWDSMLSFEGNTAPYLQYACVRIQGILRRASATQESLHKSTKPLAKTDSIDAEVLGPLNLRHPTERALALHLVRWMDTLQAVAKESAPHLLCLYLYELATHFSRFYEDCQIIDANNTINHSRLQLASLTGQTLTTGLDLLGIAIPPGM